MTRIEPYRDIKQPRLTRWLEQLRRIVQSHPDFREGDGSPEGVLKADKGARYFNRTGSAGTLLYVKTTDRTVNTGWVAYG